MVTGAAVGEQVNSMVNSILSSAGNLRKTQGAYQDGNVSRLDSLYPSCSL